MPEKTRVAVIFGGRSAEHEISVATGMEAIGALDTRYYEGIAIYIAEDGRWFTGEPLKQKAFYQSLPASLTNALEDKSVKEVVLIPSPSGGLKVLNEKTGGFLKKHKTPTLNIDVYLPALHGAFGEDGCIQGLLEMANCAYVGAGVLPAAVGMDKALCKAVLKDAGLPVLPGGTIERAVWRKDPESAKEKFKASSGLQQFPLFIKPCRQGSSIGISAAQNEAELDLALVTAFKYDTEALIEPQITDIAELNVSVLRTHSGTRTSVVEEPISETGILTFEDKYGRTGSKKGPKHGSDASMALANRTIDPAHYKDEFKAQAQSMAKLAFETLGLCGVARVDFLIDQSESTPKLYFNEINTLPGSMSYYLWEKSTPPITYPQLLNELIQEATGRQDYRHDYAQKLYIRPLFKR